MIPMPLLPTSASISSSFIDFSIAAISSSLLSPYESWIAKLILFNMNGGIGMMFLAWYFVSLDICGWSISIVFCISRMSLICGTELFPSNIPNSWSVSGVTLYVPLHWIPCMVSNISLLFDHRFPPTYYLDMMDNIYSSLSKV